MTNTISPSQRHENYSNFTASYPKMQVPFDIFRRRLPKLEKKTLQQIQTGQKITRHRTKQSLLKPFHYILGKVTCHYNKNLDMPFRTAKHVCPSIQIYYIVTLPFPLKTEN